MSKLNQKIEEKIKVYMKSTDFQTDVSFLANEYFLDGKEAPEIVLLQAEAIEIK